MSEPITICFAATSEIKTQLERWAAEDDRSVSYVLRQILKKEAQRRKQAQTEPKPVAQQAG